jgi:hypothetical protein
VIEDKDARGCDREKGDRRRVGVGQWFSPRFTLGPCPNISDDFLAGFYFVWRYHDLGFYSVHTGKAGTCQHFGVECGIPEVSQVMVGSPKLRKFMTGYQNLRMCVFSP